MMGRKFNGDFGALLFVMFVFRIILLQKSISSIIGSIIGGNIGSNIGIIGIIMIYVGFDLLPYIFEFRLISRICCVSCF